MERLVPCPGCGGSTLYQNRDVRSGAGHGPDFLPGLGGFVMSAKFAVVVCRDCGLTRLYAQPEARAKLKDSKKWRLV